LEILVQLLKFQPLPRRNPEAFHTEARGLLHRHRDAEKFAVDNSPLHKCNGHAFIVFVLPARTPLHTLAIRISTAYEVWVTIAGLSVTTIHFLFVLFAVRARITKCAGVVGFAVPVKNTFPKVASEDAATFGGTQSSVMLNTGRFAVPNAG
jgi:hypothetical protein